MKPTEYDIAPTLAGVFYNFASPVEACDNCGVQADDKLKITGTTNISHILRDYVLREDLNSLEPDDVRPFLKDRLRWRVLDVSFALLMSSAGTLLILVDSPTERRATLAH